MQKHFFKEPDDPGATVWRYMDFTKYVAMLDEGGLFFVKLKDLAKGDPFEGSFLPSETLRADSGAQVHAENAVREFLVNCWHMNEGESAAMWRLHLKSDEGIAIRSTFCRLQTVMRNGRVRQGTGTRGPVNGGVGLVKYLDYDTEGFDGKANLFQGVLHKRKCFEHEHEVRAVVVCDSGYLYTVPSGAVLESDLNDLIQEVYVGPESPIWLEALVRSVSQKYGLKAPVTRSKLLEAPQRGNG